MFNFIADVSFFEFAEFRLFAEFRRVWKMSASPPVKFPIKINQVLLFASILTGMVVGMVVLLTR